MNSHAITVKFFESNDNWDQVWSVYGRVFTKEKLDFTGQRRFFALDYKKRTDLMDSFIYEALPTRVLFGAGRITDLPNEVERLGIQRILILSTPEQGEDARKIQASIKERAVAVFDKATMHTPITVTEAALRVVDNLKVDGLIAIGGGSTIGLGKAIAFRTDLPQIVIPTTYAGSEMTPIMGETQDGIKSTKRSPKILPEVVLYDVTLTSSLPAMQSVTSGMNAIAHAVEALYAREKNPITSIMAEEGIRALAQALPAIVSNLSDQAARSDALYGAWLCGICLATAGMSLHHKLCHVLGGLFNLPHAETHTMILPHAMAYNAPNAQDTAARVARAFGGTNAGQSLFDFSGRLGAKRALRDIGMPKDGIDQAVNAVIKDPYWNPRPLEQEAIRALLGRAWAGTPPQS
jgi:alcohol dehydrogenase class IV